MKNQIIASLITCAILASIPAILIKKELKKEEKRYNELPLTDGTVVEKVDINTKDSKTMFLIDTDGNEGTIEKNMTIIKDSLVNVVIINSINKGSKIKFKDRYDNTNRLLQKDIYQIDELVANQR